MNLRKMNFFDSQAYKWDDLCYKDNEINNRLDALVQQFKIKDGGCVLDIGCGTGVISKRLLKMTAQEGCVVCLDFSLSMLKIANKKAAFYNQFFVSADAQTIPFKDNCFDNVIIFSSFPHFEDKRKVIEEAARVLTPGGVVIIAHLLGSREIANLHSRIDAAVCFDVMPSWNWMKDNIEKAGFSILEFIDKEGLYMFRAVKKRQII